MQSSQTDQDCHIVSKCGFGTGSSPGSMSNALLESRNCIFVDQMRRLPMFAPRKNIIAQNSCDEPNGRAFENAFISVLCYICGDGGNKENTFRINKGISAEL